MSCFPSLLVTTAPRSTRAAFRSLSYCALLLLIPALVGARCGADVVGETQIGQKDYEVDSRFELMQHVALPLAGSPAPAVNTLSGNLFLRLPLMNYPTPVHEMPAEVIYNSCPAEDCSSWRFFFDLQLDSGFFTDASGARYWIGDHQEGMPINGTGMVHAGRDGSSTVLRSQNGWRYHFGSDGKLRTIRPGDVDFPRMQLQYEDLPGGDRRVESILVVTAAWSSYPAYEVDYDAAGRVHSICDGAGRCAYLDWAEDELVAVYRPNDTGAAGPVGPAAFSFSYEAGRMASYANRDGNRLEFRYTGGRLSEATQVQELLEDPSVNPTHSFEYASGLTRYTNPEGAVLGLHFDSNDKLTRVENADTGSFRAWTWSANRPTSFDRNGVASSYQWTLDRLTRETTPAGNVIQYAHDRACLDPGAFSLDHPVRNRANRPAVVRAEDSLGLVAEAECDSLGRPSRARNGMGEESVLAFQGDSLNLEALARPDGLDVALSAHTLTGHAVWLGTSGGWLPTQVRVINDYGMTEQGTRALQLELGDVLSREFDREGRADVLHMRDGSALTLSYRGDGQISHVSRPGGGDSRLSYDALGRLVTLEENVDGSWVTLERYEHDLLGRVTRILRANGSSTETAYDSDGNPISIVNSWGGTPESWALLHYEQGRLVYKMDSETSPVGPEFYEYDEAGNLTRTLHPDGSATTRNYDLRGRLVSEAFQSPTGETRFTRGYGYDLANRRIRTCDGDCDSGTVLVERVIVDGRVEKIVYANGVERSLAYTGADLTRVSSVDGAGTLIEETDISYYRAPINTSSWVQHQTTTHGGVEETSFERYEFVYNKLECSDLGAAGAPCYEFDSLHNLTAVTEAGSDLARMTYNSTGNRLQSVTFADGTTAVHEYDASGFRVVHAGTPITWTAHGKPASIGASESLVWSAMGQLLARTVGSSTTDYLHGGAVRSVDGSLRLEDADFSVDLATGALRFRHKDNRGNVKFVTNENGSVVAHLVYGAFGLEGVVGADQAIHFVGQEEFSHGLMLLGARLYDGFSFLSPDPVFQVYCQYCYTFADPINWNDRTGLYPGGGEVLAYVGTMAAATGSIGATGVMGATMVLAAPPLIVFGSVMVIVGVTVLFVTADIWEANDRFDGPGNGSGGSSPRERRHQCICNGSKRGGNKRVGFGDLNSLGGLSGITGLGGLRF